MMCYNLHMKLTNFISGLQVLQKYYTVDPETNTTWDGDFLAEPTNHPVSDEDVKLLKLYGWHQDGVNLNAPYDPKFGWLAY